MQVTFLTSAFSQKQYPSTDMPEIAFAGKSNVGKSSLINTLVNRKKMAKTSAQPGRTQAINFFAVDSRVCFVDLPGYGFARVPVAVKKTWGIMVEHYLQMRPHLKAVVVIFDIRRELSPGDKDLLAWLNHYGIPVLPVLTKADKLTRNKTVVRAHSLGMELESLIHDNPTIFSAKDSRGRVELWGKIEQAITT